MQLKRQIAIGLSVYYVVCVVGLALSMHFCGGKLASMKLWQDNAGCKICAKSQKIEKESNCCKNTQVEVKVDDQHQIVDSYKLPKLYPVVLWTALFQDVSDLLGNSDKLQSNAINAPPLLERQHLKIHIQHQVFRI